MPLIPGSQLAQYEIIAPLGAGGMGSVYRARDVRLGRDVALKVMADHVAADPAMRRRFEIEVRAVAGLSHPSIMAIHELAIIGGVPVAVMELLEGETLRARIVTGICPWREAVRIGAAIADAILSMFGIALGGWLGYLIAGFIGACLLIWIVRLVRGTRPA